MNRKESSELLQEEGQAKRCKSDMKRTFGLPNQKRNGDGQADRRQGKGFHEVIVT